MNHKKLIPLLFVLVISIIFISCQDQSKDKTLSTPATDKKDAPAGKARKKNLASGKGSVSFKLDGQLYNTDPERTKCWTTQNIPLAMLMAFGDAVKVSWQMGYTEGQSLYKLDGDSKGTINFTVGEKTYWTRKSGNYLNITITDIKDKYSVKLLSGTFEGVLEDKDGNKVQITEGQFITEDI